MREFAVLEDFAGNPTLFEDDEIAASGFSGGHIEMATGTAFVAVAAGELVIGDFPVGSGMYACVPAPAVIRGRSGSRAMLATVKHYKGIFMLGGPVEDGGRLRYIDGCTDTGLIQPLRRGDPCLNYLHFPGRTRQTPHHHPSHRVGLVYAGEGVCHTRDKITAMRPGSMWLIPAGLEHWFETSGSALRIVAFHPDSECGPTDESHQMLNATLGT